MINDEEGGEGVVLTFVRRSIHGQVDPGAAGRMWSAVDDDDCSSSKVCRGDNNEWPRRKAGGGGVRAGVAE